MSRARGCLETAAVMVFALVLGGFLTSTWLRHTGGDGSREDPEVAVPPSAAPERARIRVEVKNGTGVSGAAERTTAFLRGRGFDVVDFGNAERFDHERTIVIDRVGDAVRAREVAAALQGVPIRNEPDSTLFLDVTVVIGEDLGSVLARGEEVDPESSTGWRRWIDRLPWIGRR